MINKGWLNGRVDILVISLDFSVRRNIIETGNNIKSKIFKGVLLMEEKITLGKFIARKRREIDMTQKQLADKLYVTESAVSKWERGISYPDITLVSDICGALSISEHELITATEDLRQRKIEKQANKLARMRKGYLLFFIIAYAISLVTCFIVNLAVSHTLSWFFIVLTSELLAFSFTSLPLLVRKHKGVFTLISAFASLLLLLLSCCIYTDGDWFFVALCALTFSFSVIFLPIILSITAIRHKTLISFCSDTVLLFVMIAVSMLYYGNFNQFLTVACPIAIYACIFAWLIMLTIRYFKINGFFKASVCSLISGVMIPFLDSFLSLVIDRKPLSVPSVNLFEWNGIYLNNNIMAVTFLFCLTASLIFAVGGIIYKIKNDKV